MGLNREIIKAVCFDIDGTLHDTDDQYVLRLNSFLRPLVTFFPQADLRALSRRLVMQAETPANFLFRMLDLLHLDDTIASLQDRLDKRRVGSDVQPYHLVEGVQEMLENLSHHFTLSIVSARGEQVSNTFLEYFSIRSYFTAVATAQTCRHTKPYPDPVLWAAAQMGVPPQNCLMVGDTTVDIQAGKAAGSQTAGVLCGFGTEAELAKKGADIILPSTTNLQKVLLDK